MGSGRGVKTESPHDMLQAFLNASRDDQWAILTNGIVLRLLRDDLFEPPVIAALHLRA